MVHPGAGKREGTLLNALLHHAPEANVARAGIVHPARQGHQRRVMMVARTPQPDASGAPVATHAASREYVALVHGAVRKSGTVEGAIGRHGRDRTKMAMVVVGGKPAVTHYKLRESFGGLACSANTTACSNASSRPVARTRFAYIWRASSTRWWATRPTASGDSMFHRGVARRLTAGASGNR